MRVSSYGLRQGLHPPFICPWASEGCKFIGRDQREHQDHIREVHEVPGEKARHCFDSGSYHHRIREARRKSGRRER
jgi:hypothetical protein